MDEVARLQAAEAADFTRFVPSQVTGAAPDFAAGAVSYPGSEAVRSEVEIPTESWGDDDDFLPELSRDDRQQPPDSRDAGRTSGFAIDLDEFGVLPPESSPTEETADPLPAEESPANEQFVQQQPLEEHPVHQPDRHLLRPR
jgi:hypothetical protein